MCILGLPREVGAELHQEGITRVCNETHNHNIGFERLRGSDRVELASHREIGDDFGEVGAVDDYIHNVLHSASSQSVVDGARERELHGLRT